MKEVGEFVFHVMPCDFYLVLEDKIALRGFNDGFVEMLVGGVEGEDADCFCWGWLDFMPKLVHKNLVNGCSEGIL